MPSLSKRPFASRSQSPFWIYGSTAVSWNARTDLSSGARTSTFTSFPLHAGSNGSTGIPWEHVSLRPCRSCIHLHQHPLPARVSVCPTPGLSASPCLRHWKATAELPDGRYVCVGYFRGCHVRSVAVCHLRRVLDLTADVYEC